ncbi:MAG TPA: ATP-binding cassette domain-containing protein [Gaiellaceae bacterium]|jgi:ABC-type lipoprotein export system ATPase subunit|nr:ATP-binding cassette domain-containing protein [Gaiellaceae bacterium]
MALVDARDLFAVYPSAAGGVAALQGLSISVEEGEICVVLGPSGSGKTTFLRVLAGLARPSAGGLVVAGRDLLHASPGELSRYRRDVLGYADQHYWRALEGELTAEELVAVPLGLAGVQPRERRARSRELLERVGLLDRADALPRELSGGEQQRIALCAAVAHRPRLVLADEPTGDLDVDSAAAVLALLAELVAEEGASAVIVSHDLASTEVADRVVHIRDGRLSEERAGEVETAVVGAGGWLRIPEEVLRAAGIHDRARIAQSEGSVALHPVDGRGAATAGAAAPEVEGVRGEVVAARGLWRRYGSEVALAGFDARFRPGELTVVVGPSGSGKSTLLALLSGLDVPDEGEVTVGEIVVSALDRGRRAELRRSSIAVLGQAPSLSGFLSARENVELGLALRGVEGDEARELAADALAAVGLAPHADRGVELLSAGQRERVALARVFAARTPVVVADEPTSRLDASTTLEIGRLLSRLAQATGTTVVCATHDPLLIGLADRVVRLRAGAPVASE